MDAKERDRFDGHFDEDTLLAMVERERRGIPTLRPDVGALMGLMGIGAPPE